MKATKPALAHAISIALLTGISLPTQAETITLYDYDEASSEIDQAYFTGSFSSGKNRDDAQSSYDLKLGTNLEKVLSSPDRDTSFKLDASGNVSRGSDEGDERSSRYKATASATVDNYFEPGSSGAFWYGSGSVSADDTFDDLQTKVSAGIGYGRVVNVTPMAKAIRLIEELQKRGAITGTPNRATYNQIARIIDREPEYKSKYGARSKFYQQHWVGDIEKVLQSAGLVANGLSANGVLGARDVLIDEKISVRKHGWKVRAGLSYVGTNFDGIKDKPGLELGAEYHKPINNQLQFSDEASFTTVLDSDDDSYNLNNRMSLTWEVDDRIDWINSWNLNYNHSALDGDNVTTNTLESTFAYELGNNLDLTLSGLVTNTAGNDTLSSGEKMDGTDRQMNIGVRYRLR